MVNVNMKANIYYLNEKDEAKHKKSEIFLPSEQIFLLSTKICPQTLFFRNLRKTMRKHNHKLQIHRISSSSHHLAHHMLKTPEAH